MRRNGVWVIVVLSMLSLTTNCSSNGETVTALQTQIPQPTVSLELTETLVPGTSIPTPFCPPARGEGTISPAISIYSITFVVNGLEQVVGDGDTLQASPGDEIEVKEIIICSEDFLGNSG
jgi:hypothetical protein